MNPSACAFDPRRSYVKTRDVLPCENFGKCEGCVYLQGQIEVLREMLGLPPTFLVQRPVVHDAPVATAALFTTPRDEKRMAHAETQTRVSEHKSGSTSASKGAQTTRVFQINASTATENPRATESGTQTSIEQSISVACGDDVAEHLVDSEIDEAREKRAHAKLDELHKCRGFFIWVGATRAAGSKCRERTRVIARSVVREITTDAAHKRRSLTAWFARILSRSRKEHRLGRILATWRKALTCQKLTQLETREKQVELKADEYYIAIERSKDLSHLNDLLAHEADEMSGKTQDMRHTISELSRRLRISGDCIKSMQKGFEVKCNACSKRLLRFNSAATDSDYAICAIEAVEDFENEDDNQRLVKFTNAHLTHAVSSKLFV
ncbi:hypothetical protein CYMTET_35670 [Cymbomonas tetramitiformis]|uniref:Uncharacterized protein n=1 Tax=Cymbomonas tetramitiformis TaxID=36881 RepID=A0AAE0KNQ8_9CHLO|nr:hypothetical protein CYMTET_35670 [Cymbomonas tetramitiformis]|eukprot:gene304-563_t